MKKAIDPDKTATRTNTADMPLTARQQRFVEYYLLDLNATQAAIAAGYSEKTAQEQSSRLLSNVMVQTAIADAMRARSERTQIEADAVLRRWWLLATADPNELVEIRRTCCRHCWGINFGFQRTVSEHNRDYRAWEKAQAKAKAEDREDFDEQGGIGYDARKPPHEDCVECFGEGVLNLVIKETGSLSPAARELYAGAKLTKEGIEIKMQSREEALLHVADHLGMRARKVEHAGPNGGPIRTVNQNLQALADSQEVQDALKLFRERYG